MTLRIVLSASQHNRSPASLADASKKYTRLASLVLYTEVEHRKRKAALKAAAPFGWNTLVGQHGNGDDCAMQYDRERIAILHYERILLTRKKVKPNGAPIYGLVVVCFDRQAEKRFVLGLAHFPSSVEKYATRKFKTKALRARAWMECFRKLRKRVNKLKRKHRAEGALLTGDFNLNEKRPAVRLFRNSIAPRYKSAWKRYPYFGTLGKRLIDWVLFKGKIYCTAEVIKNDNSSDHRPSRIDLEWRSK